MAKEDAPKVKSTKSKDGKKEKKPKREGGGGGGGLTKPMILSDTLSKLLGETMLSRAETVKNLYVSFEWHIFFLLVCFYNLIIMLEYINFIIINIMFQYITYL